MSYPLPRTRDYRKAVEGTFDSDLPAGLRRGGYVADADLANLVEDLRHAWGGRDERLFVENLWLAVRRRVEAGDPPAPYVVGTLVRRGEAIPGSLQGYVADLIEGKVRHRRGPGKTAAPAVDSLPFRQLTCRLTWSGLRFVAEVDAIESMVPSMQQWVARVAWAYRVVRWKRAYNSSYWAKKRQRDWNRRYPGRGIPPGWNALDEALSRVAQESGISRHTLRTWLYPDRGRR